MTSKIFVHEGCTSSTTLVSPDFTTYARAFGSYAERAERIKDFAAAFHQRGMHLYYYAEAQLTQQKLTACVDAQRLQVLNQYGHQIAIV